MNDGIQGLSQAEAARRLAEEGANELPSTQRHSFLTVVREVFREPMFQLLMGAGLVYLLIGDLGEALLLLCFATVSIGITILQQSRTERALDALRDLSSPRALVLREGQLCRIAGREVVRGDLLVLSEGDRVAADARLLRAEQLQADESLLTGESVPVSKRAAVTDDGSSAAPGGDDLPWVYSGALIVRGSGLGEVTATGASSEIGRIGTLLQQVQTEPTPLSRQLRKLVRSAATLGLIISAIVVVLYGLLRDAWLEGLLSGIALAMSLLPEELPLVLTVFLALGARRIAKARVLARRSEVIEALGAATVLCTDKTGTLTQNRMQVAELRIGADVQRLGDGKLDPDGALALLRTAVRASDSQATDPMERALHEALRALKPAAEAAEPLRQYGLSPQLLAMTRIWRDPAGRCHAASKGAPEAIALLCGLEAEAREALMAEVGAMAARGLRVIAVASGEALEAPLPEDQRGLPLRLCGLVGLADPIREGVPQAVRTCREAGIRVIMITGDFPATAHAIAAAAGLDGAGSVLTGAELDGLDDSALRARLHHTSVCARVMPRHKLRIVEVLKQAGEVVAMTGDGVNDAPSLKAAHIGIAMGGRGTDVAREASSLVLLDDDFSSIVAAVRLGRRIFDNIRKAIAYILAVHVPIAGLSLFPLLLGWPMILGPVHIVFLELVIDPVCSIVFEAEETESDAMRKPPRAPERALFSGRLIAWSLAQGSCVLALVLGVFALAQGRGLSETDARAISFVALVCMIVSLILVNRAFGDSVLEALRRPNAALWRVVLATAALLALVLYVPGLRQLYGFGLLHADELLGAGLCGVILLLALEGVKHLLFRRALP